MNFAIQIDVRDGSTHHVFGSSERSLREAEAVRDGWRSQPPENYYTLIVAGSPQNIFVRDIVDVRVVAGDGR